MIEASQQAYVSPRACVSPKGLMGKQMMSSAVQKDEIASEPRLRRPLRIALFGFGTVGSSVARILVESKPDGLELAYVFNRNVARKKADWTPADLVWTDDADAVLDSDVDVIVELAGDSIPRPGGCARPWRRVRALSPRTRS